MVVIVDTYTRIYTFITGSLLRKYIYIKVNMYVLINCHWSFEYGTEVEELIMHLY